MHVSTVFVCVRPLIAERAYVALHLVRTPVAHCRQALRLRTSKDQEVRSTYACRCPHAQCPHARTPARPHARTPARPHARTHSAAISVRREYFNDILPIWDRYVEKCPGGKVTQSGQNINDLVTEMKIRCGAWKKHKGCVAWVACKDKGTTQNGRHPTMPFEDDWNPPRGFSVWKYLGPCPGSQNIAAYTVRGDVGSECRCACRCFWLGPCLSAG